MKLRLILATIWLLPLSACISSYVRLPSSATQIYSNQDVRQALTLVAQNNVFIHIPDATTREFEKSEIDAKCSQARQAMWSEKLTVYLNEFRKRPELLSRINIVEIKRGDTPDVKMQYDLDGAATVSIQFVKFENHGKVSFQTQLPCKASVAEYLGRDLVKTDYEFPDVQKFVQVLQQLPEKKSLARFQFSNEFLAYLAERGAVFKFSHEMSFEKTSQGKYVLTELLNRLAAEVKKPFHQHMNYWFRQINQHSSQAQLIQMFGLQQDQELKAGIKVDVLRDNAQVGNSDLTYLYISYNVENDRVNSVGLEELEKCLQSFTDRMTGIGFRRPAATGDKESYLRPGYNCNIPFSE